MNPKQLLPTIAMAFAASSAWAQPAAPVTASVPWARVSVPGQSATGVFLTLRASEPLTLIGASSPVASAAEVHEMKFEGDVMRMRQIPSLTLPAHQSVELKPGGYHLMLQGLKAPLAANTSIPLTLTFRSAGGELRQLALQVPVAATAPGAGAASAAGSHKH